MLDSPEVYYQNVKLYILNQNWLVNYYWESQPENWTELWDRFTGTVAGVSNGWISIRHLELDHGEYWVK